MSPAQFKAWRKSLALKQKEAAEKLGLKKRMIQYYETGRREGQKVEIPKAIRLACFALQSGVVDFEGAAAIRAPAHRSPELDASEREVDVSIGRGRAQEAALRRRAGPISSSRGACPRARRRS